MKQFFKNNYQTIIAIAIIILLMIYGIFYAEKYHNLEKKYTELKANHDVLVQELVETTKEKSALKTENTSLNIDGLNCISDKYFYRDKIIELDKIFSNSMINDADFIDYLMDNATITNENKIKAVKNRYDEYITDRNYLGNQYDVLTQEILNKFEYE